MNQSKQINICIGCNQGCLDHVFKNKRATCLVNPQAAFELDYPLEQATRAKNVISSRCRPCWFIGKLLLGAKRA